MTLRFSILLCLFFGLTLTACKGKEVEVPLMIQESASPAGAEAYKKCVKEKPKDWGEVDEDAWPEDCEIYTMGRYGTFE